MPKILVIDDDKDFQDSIKLILEQNGFDTAAAYGPEEGISEIKSQKPDLVVLDVMMPSNFEGFDVARAVREELKLSDLPIIMLTAVHDVKKVPYRFAPDEEYLPVDYFYDKPVAPDVLVGKIREILNIADSSVDRPQY
jgi:DNA-binding response OmpR family regulator